MWSRFKLTQIPGILQHQDPMLLMILWLHINRPQGSFKHLVEAALTIRVSHSGVFFLSALSPLVCTGSTVLDPVVPSLVLSL